MAVEIYEECNDTVAHLGGVKNAIRAKLEQAESRAKAILGAKPSGRTARHSSIGSYMGDTDGHLYLEDPDGGALAIEFGRTGAMGKGGPTQGVHAITGDVW